MGTNFYWLNEDKFYSDDPRSHIGKRSGAGGYCWDCGITLCKWGEGHVHTGDSDYHDECPRCGKTREHEGLERGSAAVELGFAKPNNKRPMGVGSCSSFSWAQHPEDVKAEIETGRAIIDEYGRIYSGAAFLEMLSNNCPIQFHCIGQWFS